MSQSILKAAAGVAALAAIAFGASAIAGASGSSNRSGAAMGGPPGAASGAPGAPGGAPGAAGNFPGPPGGAPPGGANGARPQGRPPFMGQPVTGATAAKVKAAALARYPGTIERIEAIPGLGYVAHVFRSGGGGEVHVLVNRQFHVTGLAPDPGGRPPGAGASGSSS
ncbi:MAG: hypothetical protein QOC77_1355 [Thermoleophilaceae bacterium]|jgi:hypothetical protein|nr:hypothetical protein [Thermoleophilaceae bacterium]MEA2470759.1 hypothetical protein [Thermoleophilaceae bacterium]